MLEGGLEVHKNGNPPTPRTGVNGANRFAVNLVVATTTEQTKLHQIVD